VEDLEGGVYVDIRGELVSSSYYSEIGETMLEQVTVGEKVIPLTPVHVLIGEEYDDCTLVLSTFTDFTKQQLAYRLGSELDEKITRFKEELIPLHGGYDDKEADWLIFNIHERLRDRLVIMTCPENSLHPRRMRPYAALLRKVSMETSCQIVVVTFSPYFRSEFSVEEVTLCHRGEGGRAAYHPLRDTKFLTERMGTDFYLGELWYNLPVDEFLQ
jgi:hypothetical protein